MLNHPFRFSLCRPRYLASVQLVEAVDDVTWEYLLTGWGGDLGKLSPQAQAALLDAVPEVHNEVFKTKPLAGFDGRCADYCSLLAHKLHEQGIDVKMIGGLYFDDLLPGTTIEDLEAMVEEGEEDEEIFYWGSHTWLEIEDQLIDPTVGQFFNGREDIQWTHQSYLPSQIKFHSFLLEWEGPRSSLVGRTIYDQNGKRSKV